MKFSVVNFKEDDMYVALCPEVDIASQGYTIEESKANLKEAIELFYEYASPEEIKERINRDIQLSTLEVDFA